MSVGVSKKILRANRRLCLYHTPFDSRKKTLLFIHGLGGQARDWHYQWRHYENDYNLISLDLYGHGNSGFSKNKYDYSLFSFILDFQALIDSNNYHHITVFCHGYGALIGLHLASLYPGKITKLAMLNPVTLEYDQLLKSKWWHHMPAVFIRLLFRLGFWNGMWYRRLPKKDKKAALVLKYALRMISYTPKIAYHDIKQNVLLLLSKHHRLITSKLVAKYYNKRFKKIRVKFLASDKYILMKYYSQVNYYSDQLIEHLNTSAFRNLVFEGAGIRGIAYSGVVSALDDLGIMTKIQRVVGVSAGAIYATLVALNYDKHELYDVVTSLDFRKFVDGGSSFLKNTTGFLSDYGWYRGDNFYQWMGEQIAYKASGNADITFLELQQLGGLDLHIIATNMSKHCADVFSVELTPDIKVRDAIRMSMSIPLYYRAVKQGSPEGECVMIDGGMSWNYPVHIFDYKKYIDNPINGDSGLFKDAGEEYCFNHETLGFRLEPLFQLPNYEQRDKQYKKIRNIVDYARVLMEFIAEVSVKGHLPKHDWNRTVFVDTLDIQAMDFGITEAQVKALIQQGKLGVQKHFAWRMSQDGIRFPQ
ncbi:alpha/beta fold hydrolase [Thiotrichales bacterium 19S9-12]|nr:alpha/beta fold hydrolase [Thiotrichales bacterium 19S9-11]MCF6811894.1 alpha/beta fold hydrolase [Thiotrichales bacterium 19S9-12]